MWEQKQNSHIHGFKGKKKEAYFILPASKNLGVITQAKMANQLQLPILFSGDALQPCNLLFP